MLFSKSQSKESETFVLKNKFLEIKLTSQNQVVSFICVFL